MGIEYYSTNPADNNRAPPEGWPEGMAPSGVNESARQNMADLRAWYEDSQWVNLGIPVEYASDTTFTLPNGVDYTEIFHVGRRIKAFGTATTTIYGTITGSVHSGSTTVTVSWDSGDLEEETLTIYIAALTKTNDSMPYINKVSESVASASTIDLNKVRGDLVDITGTTAITAITLDAGQERTLRFTGILTLTNGASLVLPSGADITTAAGDFAIVRGYASGIVRVVAYSKANGQAVAPTGSLIDLSVNNLTVNNTLNGAIFSNKNPIINSNVADPNNDIDISAGYCFDVTNNIGWAGPALTKRMDLGWSAGNNGGFLDTGSKANNTWYHTYAIYNPASNSPDYVASVNPSAPTLPIGYTRYKRLRAGQFFTDGSGNIIPFFSNGIATYFTTVRQAVSLANPGTSAVLNTLPVPLGIKTCPIAQYIMRDITPAADRFGLFTSPQQTDSTPSSSLFTNATKTSSEISTFSGLIETNTSSQIRSRFDFSDADVSLIILVSGWMDFNI